MSHKNLNLIEVIKRLRSGHFNRLIICLILGISLTAQSCAFATGSGPRGVWFSDDAGQNWHSVNVLMQNQRATQSLDRVSVRNLTLAPDRRDVLYLVSPAGLYATDNAGQTWHHILSGLNVFDVAVANTNPAVIYAVGIHEGRGAVFKSYDRGRNWERVFIEAAANTALSVAVSPTDQNEIVVGFQSGLIISSRDGGQTWTPQKSMGGAIIQMEFFPADPNNLVLLIENRGLFLSRDRLQTFIDITDSLKNRQFLQTPLFTEPGRDYQYHTPSRYLSFHMVPNNPHTMYLAADTGLFRTTNAGQSWQGVHLPVDPYNARTLAVDTSPNGDVVYVSIDTVVYRSDNTGASFSMTKLNTQRLIVTILTRPDNPDIIYAGMR